MLQNVMKCNLADMRQLATWILSTAAVIVSMSLVISTGANIQNYAFALIHSDASSIYGSAYQDSLIKFPELRQWLSEGIRWSFLFMATAIIFFSLRRSGSRQVFVSSILPSFLVLAVYDLLIGLIGKTLSDAYLFENVIADAVGGALLAFILTAVLIVGNLCLVHLPGRQVWRRLVAGFVTIIAGVSLNSAVFYAAEFFYSPVPVKLDVVLDYPVGGNIVSDPDAAKDRKNSEEDSDEPLLPFRLFPANIDNAAIHWNSPTNETGFFVDWSLLSKPAVFDATIELYADCFSDKIDNATPVQSHQVRINNISSLNVSLDAGASEFGTFSRSQMSGGLVTDFGMSVLYSRDLELSSKRITTTQFVEKNATLVIKNTGRDLGFYVNATLLASKGQQGIIVSNRTLAVKIDGKSYFIEAEKPRGAKKIGELACRSLEPGGAVKQERATIAGADSFLGALIRVTKKQVPASIYGIEDNVLKVSGGNGWVSLTRPIEQAADQDKPGSVNFVSFKGNIASLDIDGRAVTGRPIDRYNAFGEFTGSFESSTKLRFSGRAQALWKNAERVNPTRWERLSWEQRLAIMGAIFSMLAPIVGYIAIQIRNDIDIDWRSTPKRSFRRRP
jgi:hypothetical protein